MQRRHARRRRQGRALTRARARRAGQRRAGLALLGGVFATALAGLVMALLRSTLQVRSVPERLVEWLLLLMTPAQMEAGLQRFAFDAKDYALLAVTLATLTAMAALGAVVLSRGWPAWRLISLGPMLWLVLMVVVTPLSGAGVFAVQLVEGTWPTIAGYLAVSLVYAGGLALARLVLESEPLGAHEPVLASEPATRRAVVAGLAGGLVAVVSTYALERLRPSGALTAVKVVDAVEPEPVPTVGPNQVSQPSTPVEAPTPTSEPLPQPRPGRPLKRDKDGAILASGRRKGELTDLITQNDDFYIVTKNAAGDPVVRPETWRLRIDGEVARAIELDYASLRKLPAVEVGKSLECISNFAAKCELVPYGCDLISTARWKGVRVADLLELAGGARPEATSLSVVAADEYTSGLPMEVALNPETLLAYEMNGEPLPREHGYPARLLVPGVYGMKDAKWIIALRPQVTQFVDWYGQRNWSKDALVKSMTRIDVPTPGASLAPGEYNIAGVAYTGDRGVARVEFSTDDGETWQPAELVEPPIGQDAWVRWIGRFSLPPGAQLSLRSRVTDGAGMPQAKEFSLPEPDGSAGWPTVQVIASN
jgi:DMSO/TMAO reductase YedYZ molybdopterin-dependent catalytic subunit